MLLRRSLTFTAIFLISFLVTSATLRLAVVTLRAEGFARRSLGLGSAGALALSVAQPTNGAILAGLVSVFALASDVGLADLQFEVSGTALGQTITSGSCIANWDTTTWTDGNYTVTAVGHDDAGNMITSVPVTVAVQNALAQIANVLTSVASDTSALVSWATTQPAESAVDYGLTSAYGSTTPLETSLATQHSTTLTGLSGGATYHARIRAWNAAGVMASSADFTFATMTSAAPPGSGANSAPAPDPNTTVRTIQPITTCTGTVPAKGATCSNGVSIAASSGIVSITTSPAPTKPSEEPRPSEPSTPMPQKKSSDDDRGHVTQTPPPPPPPVCKGTDPFAAIAFLKGRCFVGAWLPTIK